MFPSSWSASMTPIWLLMATAGWPRLVSRAFRQFPASYYPRRSRRLSVIGPFLGGRARRARRRIVVGLAEETPAETMSTVMQTHFLNIRRPAIGTSASRALRRQTRPGLPLRVSRGLPTS